MTIKRILEGIQNDYGLTKPEEYRCREAIKRTIKKAEQMDEDFLKELKKLIYNNPTLYPEDELFPKINKLVVEKKQKLSAELKEKE